MGAHLAWGAVLGSIALYYGRTTWPDWQAVIYVALVSSQMLLLAIWLGFSRDPWWQKGIGLVAGLAWLNFLAFAPELDRIWQTTLLISSPVLVVGACCAVWSRFVAKLEWRDAWPERTIAEELQFSLRTLVGLTVTLSLLLALGRFFHWLRDDGSGAEVLVPILVIKSSLATGVVVWGCLGQGRAILRVPVTFLVMVALGLLFPFYVGMERHYFIIWPVLLAMIAVYTCPSLLVVRSCGYRVIRREKAAPTAISSAAESFTPQSAHEDLPQA